MLFIPAGFFGANSPFGWHWAPVAEILGGGGDAAAINWPGAMTALTANTTAARTRATSAWSAS